MIPDDHFNGSNWLDSFEPSDVYGPRHVLDTLAGLVDCLKVRDLSVRGRRCLELGCGAHQPVAVASLLYLNGASSVVANDLKPAIDPKRSAVLLSELLQYAARNPEHFQMTPGPLEGFQLRLNNFDLDALASGDLYAGCVNVPIKHVVASLFDLQPSMGPFDLITSRAVLEHFLDFESLCQMLFRLSSPHAVGCHLHDFVDHRYYKSGQYHPWSFLEEMEDWTKGVNPADVSNRLRLSQVIEALERSGFDVHVTWTDRQVVPPDIFARMMPPFRFMSEEDLSTLRARLLLDVRGSIPHPQKHFI